MSAEPKIEAPLSDGVDVEQAKEHHIHHSEVLEDKGLMNEAFQGENAEHEMTLWQAAKNHPMACMWAFIMCFTIVSNHVRRLGTGESPLICGRSWSRSTCF